MNNKIIEIQETILRQIRRLDNDNTMSTEGKEEIARSNALTNASQAYIKAVNVQLAVMNAATRAEVTTESLQETLGITDETQAEQETE